MPQTCKDLKCQDEGIPREGAYLLKEEERGCMGGHVGGGNFLFGTSLFFHVQF